MPQLPRKSGTGAAESGLEPEPPPGDPEAGCEGPSAAPGPQGLHLLEGFPGKQRPGALEMNLLLLFCFLPQVSKGPQPRETPSILSSGLRTQERPRWDSKEVWRSEAGKERSGDCVQFAPK